MERTHNELFFYKICYTPGMFSLIDRAFGAFGRDGSSAVATTVAAMYVSTHPSVTQIVRSNLALLDPDGATDRAAKNVFHNFAFSMADYLAIGNLPCREASALCVERHGLEHIRAVQKEGRGAVLATGHFGFFEFGGLLLAELGIPTSILTLGEPSEDFTRWRAEYRLRWGVRTIEVGNDSFSSVQIVRALQEGNFCAMLVDRPYHGPHISFPLPGGSIRFSTSFALLAYLADCPILPVTIVRRDDGNYRMTALSPIYLDRSLPRNESIETATRLTATALAAEFIRTPQQWYHFIPIGL